MGTKGKTARGQPLRAVLPDPIFVKGWLRLAFGTRRTYWMYVFFTPNRVIDDGLGLTVLEKFLNLS